MASSVIKLPNTENHETLLIGFFEFHSSCDGVRDGTVEALRYMSEGHRFDSRWCHWNSSLTQSFQLHYGPGVDRASNRNEYQEYFLGVKVVGA